MIIYKNNDYIKIEDSFVNTSTDAFNYGFSFFETINYRNGKLELLYEHINRLEKSVDIFKKKKIDLESIENIVENLIERNKLSKKLNTVKIIYSPMDDIFIVEIKKNRYTDEFISKGFKVKYANDKRNEFNRVTFMKSSNYLVNKLNLKEVRQLGYDECIFLNTSNNITEGSYTNIFFEKNGKIYTPKISDGILPGVMRENIIKNLKKDGNIIIEKSLSRNFYKECQGAFLTNSLMGKMKITKFEEKDYIVL